MNWLWWTAPPAKTIGARLVRPLGEWGCPHPLNERKVAWRANRLAIDPEYRAKRLREAKLWRESLKADPVKWEAWRQKRSSYELKRRKAREAANPELAERRHAADRNRRNIPKATEMA